MKFLRNPGGNILSTGFSLLVISGLALMLCGSSGCGRGTGPLRAPSAAARWSPSLLEVFDNRFTQDQINLAGRAPIDVMDQQLFSHRLGHASLVVLVEVDQLFNKGRHQADAQYVEVVLGEVMLGKLDRKVSARQLVRLSGDEPLPLDLKGTQMVMFIRWAPGEQPSYRHHLTRSNDQVLDTIRDMVAHAQGEGYVTGSGRTSRKIRKSRRRAARRASRKSDATP